jgi:hypothetical protein
VNGFRIESCVVIVGRACTSGLQTKREMLPSGQRFLRAQDYGAAISINTCIRLKPFKAEWQLYVPPALTITNVAFCIYGFRMILCVSSDHFLKQH